MNDSTVFLSGLALSVSLIMAIGPQNVHVLRMGLTRQHLALTVLTSIVADMALIALGVFGLGQLGALPDKIYGAMIGGGVLFLLHYGLRAWGRFWRTWRALRDIAKHSPQPSVDATIIEAEPEQQQQPIGPGRAIAVALAFSWLNPHAWIDTAALIGTASLAYGAQAGLFGWGAMAGSVLWFTGLGAAAYFLGKVLRGQRFWMWLDAAVALMMWTLALILARSLFASA
ncbi:lysine transporter LysE [Allofranklinella schreckenbergeri]|uniref:Lysine transporter LysE n=1 Tax=Allofranklinella schreckenbergeri TaxID=1076744 RepID=A0A3M6R7S3_9BURK|nr:LysE family transporter [Allofranklinella schreckenbergeri]RMX11387.1 lysine transporter LysE [Allofranklinella schreckenbergeri]